MGGTGSTGKWFIDRTEEIAGYNVAFEKQLKYRHHYWLQRIERSHRFDTSARNGLAVGDANGDGLEDVYVGQPRGLPNLLLVHQPDGTATNQAAESGVDWLDQTSAALFADLDNDGDQDLTIGTPNETLVMVNDGTGKFSLTTTLPRQDRHYLALRMRGVTTNRDAIGSRVAVTIKGATQTKTLRAGDGYLAQSIKWLHFGLGANADIERVSVQWPGGATEQFSGVTSNGRFELKEGTGKAESVDVIHEGPLPTTTPVAIKQDDTEAASIRVLSVSDVPVPKLTYEAFTGAKLAAQTVTPSERYPTLVERKTTLVNLFATWCQPCRVELTDLASHAAELKKSGVDVVALCVDPLDPASNVKTDDIQKYLAELGFPFRSGVATISIVETLQQLNNHMFDLHLSLPVPMSVLIDRDGKLVALYKGPVETSQVLRDVQLARHPREERRDAAVPFAGIWHERLNRTSHVPLLSMLIHNGLLDEADDFVRRLTAQKRMLLPVIVKLGMAFYHQGNAQKAQKHLDVARRMDPSFVGVEIAMGLQREKENRPDHAMKLYREALRRSPNNVVALNNLAWLLATQSDRALRNGAEALQLASRAVKLTHRSNGSFLGTLAAAHAELGQTDVAVKVADEGIAVAKAQGKIKVASDLAAQRARYAAPSN